MALIHLANLIEDAIRLKANDKPKTLHNTDGDGAEKNVPDIKKWGDPDKWQLICKASSEKEGWMKSTKAMGIPGKGCVMQVSTQQRNPDGSYSLAEAITFIPGVKTFESMNEEDEDDLEVKNRMLIPMQVEEESRAQDFWRELEARQDA